MPRSRDPIILVEKLIPGGDGFGRLPDGRSLMVRGALPGDRVRVSRVSEHSGFARAAEYERVEASPDRRTPVCSVCERCGGCDLMPLTEQAQRRAKLGLFREALMRVGGLGEFVDSVSLHEPGPRLGYRSRLRLQIDDQGRVGFFHRASRTLVEPERCHVAGDAVQRTLDDLRALSSRQKKGLAAFASVEVRQSETGVSLFFTLKPAHSYAPVESEAVLAHLRKGHVVVVAGSGARVASERFELSANCYMYSSPGAFTQVNWHVNLALVERVTLLAEQVGAQSFCDLYSGSGNFALPLARGGRKGTGVESSRVAVEQARAAAKEQGLGRVRFVHDDAARYAERAAKSGQRYDFVLVDPPRSGVKKGLSSMAALGSSLVVMLSCDPVTFARDLARLRQLGFSLGGLEAFDMFPQTHHVEGLAWLFRE